MLNHIIHQENANKNKNILLHNHQVRGGNAQFYQGLMKLHSNKDYQMLKEVQTNKTNSEKLYHGPVSKYPMEVRLRAPGRTYKKDHNNTACHSQKL